MAKPIFVIEVSKKVPENERVELKRIAKAEVGEEYFVLVFATSSIKDGADVRYSILKPI